MDITVNNVTKIIKGNTVLSDINLEFQSGKIYGIVGKNGSGKTMLLRILAGLIRPTEGTVSVDGQKLHKDISFPPDMGIIIEKPELLEQLTGLENLKLFSQYSLGMKQKIGIIQAIMEGQRLLILDEPFNALDEATVVMLRELFQKYRQENRLLILTSHHREDIDILCDEIFAMQDGGVDGN